MRIAAVADTHLPRFGRRLPRALLDGMRDARVDLILHAGDWTDPFVLDLLEVVAPVAGVAGNNDGPALHRLLGVTRIVDAGGARIGITHGHLGRGRSTPDRAVAAFADEHGLAGIVFGHSHQPLVRPGHGTPWLVNPGSPTDRRRQPAYTWALLEVEPDAVRDVTLHRFTDRSPD